MSITRTLDSELNLVRIVQTNEFGQKIKASWETFTGRLDRNGWLHREEPHPALELWDATTQTRTLALWAQHNEKQRSNDQPAIVRWYPSGVLRSEEWFEANKWSRSGDRPAIVKYNEQGVMTLQAWYRSGVLHREHDQPSLYCYDETGRCTQQQWHQGGKLHRECGPAIVEYGLDGQWRLEHWYVHGSGELGKEQQQCWEKAQAEKQALQGLCAQEKQSQ